MYAARSRKVPLRFLFRSYPFDVVSIGLLAILTAPGADSHNDLSVLFVCFVLCASVFADVICAGVLVKN